MTNEHKNMPNATDKYKRRFPVNRTKQMNAKTPILSMILKMVAARSKAIGDSYALKIWTINGRIA